MSNSLVKVQLGSTTSLQKVYQVYLRNQTTLNGSWPNHDLASGGIRSGAVKQNSFVLAGRMYKKTQI